MYRTVDTFNAAIAKRSAVTRAVSQAVRIIRNRGKATDAELRELKALHRLPSISDKEARTLLGPLADTIPTPKDLKKIADVPPPSSTTSTTTAPPDAAAPEDGG